METVATHHNPSTTSTCRCVKRLGARVTGGKVPTLLQAVAPDFSIISLESRSEKSVIHSYENTL